MSKIYRGKEVFLKVNDIFYSIQGESSYAGYPCLFIRLAGCNISCSYCDTKEAATGNNAKEMDIPDIISSIKKYGGDIYLVEITGGEPLMQDGVYELMNKLLNLKYTVLLETNGTLDLKNVPKKIIKIMDIKCPSSSFEKCNNYQNIDYINKNDEIKFVIGTEEDYNFAKQFIGQHNLKTQKIIFSPIENIFPAKDLAHIILQDRLNVRIGLQLHKILNLK
jgi:7-carboxy-7-deazaguanine synthase